jgi:hypothetical protein
MGLSAGSDSWRAGCSSADRVMGIGVPRSRGRDRRPFGQAAPRPAGVEPPPAGGKNERAPDAHALVRMVGRADVDRLPSSARGAPAMQRAGHHVRQDHHGGSDDEERVSRVGLRHPGQQALPPARRRDGVLLVPPHRHGDPVSTAAGAQSRHRPALGPRPPERTSPRPADRAGTGDPLSSPQSRPVASSLGPPDSKGMELDLPWRTPPERASRRGDERAQIGVKRVLSAARAL